MEERLFQKASNHEACPSALWILLLALSCVLLPFRATALVTEDSVNWQQLNLNSAEVYSLAVDPNNSDTIFVGAFKASVYNPTVGVYKSTDGGESWDGIGPEYYVVYALAIARSNSNNSNVIYAGTYSKIFKRIDDGDSWTEIEDDSLGQGIRALAVDPNDSNLIYAGTSNGVFKSEDGGNTWTQIENAPAHISTLAVDPQNSNSLYAGTSSGLFKSEDGGNTWTQIENAPAHISTLAVDPQNSNSLYAGTSSGLFKSEDGGNTWTSMDNNLLSGQRIHVLAIDPNNANTLYAGTSSGLFKTEDGGNNWFLKSQVREKNVRVNTLAINPENSAIFAGTDDGIFRSTNGGYIWEDLGGPDMPYQIYVRSLVWGLGANEIFIGTEDGVYEGWGGSSWEAFNNGLPSLEGYYPRIETLLLKDGNLYAGTDMGVFKTEYCGYCSPTKWQSWNEFNSGFGDGDSDGNIPYIFTLVSAPDGNRIYAGTSDGIYWTDGDNWIRLSTDTYLNPVYSIAFNPNDSNIIYAGTQNGIWMLIRDDDYEYWSAVQLYEGGDIYSLAIDPEHPNIIYAGTSNGVVENEDAGDSWSPFGLSSQVVNTLIFDPNNSANIYAGTNVGTFYLRRTDLAATYNLTINITGQGIGDVTSDPSGINCPEACSGTFDEGTRVTLTAQPALELFYFSGWSGDCAACGSNSSCTVAMDSDKTCYAEFESFENRPPVITNFSADPTEGMAPLVISFACSAYDPDGGNIESIEWFFDSDASPDSVMGVGNGNFTTTHTYTEPGVYKAHCRVWDYDQQSTESDNITITVTAPLQYFELNVNVNPEVGGSVTGEGIECHGECTMAYEAGTSVTLTAEPAEGYEFTGWTGACEGCENAECTFIMDDNKSCGALFEPIPVFSWIDITDFLEITHSPRQLYDRVHRCFFINIDVENPGADIAGPIRMIITEPSLPVKTVNGVGLEPAGTTDDGDPYFMIVPNDATLDEGGALRNLRVNFQFQRKRLTYGIKIEKYGIEE